MAITHEGTPINQILNGYRALTETSLDSIEQALHKAELAEADAIKVAAEAAQTASRISQSIQEMVRLKRLMENTLKGAPDYLPEEE